jgi:hypothetical protein
MNLQRMKAIRQHNMNSDSNLDLPQHTNSKGSKARTSDPLRKLIKAATHVRLNCERKWRWRLRGFIHLGRRCPMTSTIRDLNCVTKHNCRSERRLKGRMPLSATLQTTWHHYMSIIWDFQTLTLATLISVAREVIKMKTQPLTSVLGAFFYFREFVKCWLRKSGGWYIFGTVRYLGTL